jgi:hypothetical protein
MLCLQVIGEAEVVLAASITKRRQLRLGRVLAHDAVLNLS